MARFGFFGEALPDIDLEELKGKLIVLEGTDGVGRSTHIGLLKQWLENNGHAVLDTGMTRSALAGKRLKQAKKGHTLGGITMSLFYATDFADRLENEIIPALRAGFIVLTDRYIYSLMARAIVRGADAAQTGVGAAAVRNSSHFGIASFFVKASIGALRALPTAVHYATSKAAMIGFTKCLSREAGTFGVKVNAIAIDPRTPNTIYVGMEVHKESIAVA